MLSNIDQIAIYPLISSVIILIISLKNLRRLRYLSIHFLVILFSGVVISVVSGQFNENFIERTTVAILTCFPLVFVTTLVQKFIFRSDASSESKFSDYFFLNWSAMSLLIYAWAT